MLNKVQIIGRLGRDVELRYTQSGSPVANFTVATDESYTDRNGNRMENTEWHRVVAFNKQAETCHQYISKGSLVYVEGRLRTRKYTDREGQERSTTEIHADRVIFLDRKTDRQDGDFRDKRPAPGAGGGYGDQNRKSGGGAPRDANYGGGAPRPPRQDAGTVPPDMPPFPQDPLDQGDDMPF